VSQVVDIRQSVTFRIKFRSRQWLEIHVVEADVADVAFLLAAFAAPAVDEVDNGVPDTLDRGNVQLARTGGAGVAPSAQRDCSFVGCLRVLHAKGDRADAGPVQTSEPLGEGIRLRIDDVIDAALAVEDYVLVAVPGNRSKTEALEERAHRLGVWGGVLDELEAVRTHGVVPCHAAL
jgi:hypothetical protein